VARVEVGPSPPTMSGPARQKQRCCKAMSVQDDTRVFFETVAQVLIRCFWGGVLLLFLWVAAYLAAGNCIYGVHARLFPMTRSEFDVMHYFGMTLMKMGLITGFLLPYCALRLALRRR